MYRNALRKTTLALGLFVVATPLGLWLRVQTSSETLPGLRINGSVLPVTDRPSESLSGPAEIWLGQSVLVESGGVSVQTTRRGLGARIPIEELDRRLVAIGRSGNPITDLLDIVAARQGRLNLPWPVDLDRHALSAFLERVRRQVDSAPVPGRIDFDAGVVRPQVPGVRLDLDGAMRALAPLLTADAVTAKLPTRSLMPSEGEPVPKGLSLRAVLGAWETTFHRYGDHADRAHNVRLAASRLDGAIIGPGDTLSFNGRVGERRSRAGFRMAPVILRGEIAEDVGGGVCQVASTLHAAAFFGGFDLLEHTPHSRPSSYIPMGLDSTVVWPEVDLKIRNSFPFPVAVRARVWEATLRVEILGDRAPREVEMDREFVDTRTFTQHVVPDSTLPAGVTEVGQMGIRGYSVLRLRRIFERDRMIEERRLIVYPPTDRIIRVGAGGPGPATPATVAQGEPDSLAPDPG